MKIPLYKQILSYLHPVWVMGAEDSANNPELELLYYRGRWQLATRDAIYSDGDRYTPLLTAYRALEGQLPAVKKVLVLGAGLGSAVQVMKRKGYSPDFTLVETDETVVKWARALLPPYEGNVTFLQADAAYYLDTDTTRYDLLVVDVFIGRVVPDFVTTEAFIQNCRQHVAAGGSFALNYIIHGGKQWEQFRELFQTHFPNNHIITNGINRILVATV